MIRVLIVDDSLIQQELLTYSLSSDPDIKVIGIAKDGTEAIRKVSELKPDIVTMDINMPKMGGIEAIREIMQTHPVPIIVISSSTTDTEVQNTFQAIEAGAVAVSEKVGFSPENTQAFIKSIKLMSEIKVVKRRPHLQKPKIAIPTPDKQIMMNLSVIAIAASTGGPAALQTLFKELKSDFPPILVVQHISAGFLQGLADWLAQTAKVAVKVATAHEKMVPNQIYLAPDGYHMGMDAVNKIVLSQDTPIHSHRPSASYLFRSVANMAGKHALGIILTGMGRDGADELKTMKEAGAITMAQDEESSVVYGMPREAAIIKAATKIMDPEAMAEFINEHIRPIH